MIKYNTGVKYNFSPDTGGARYNSPAAYILISLSEVFSASDKAGDLFVKHVIHQDVSPVDSLVNFVLQQVNEGLFASDELEYSVLQTIAENANMKDSFKNLMVQLHLKDKFDILDQISKVNAVIEQKEYIKMKDKMGWEAAIKVAEELGLEDAKKIFALLKRNEYAIATDRSPRTAVSDFYIGHIEGLDPAMEYFAPLEMIYDPERSDIQIMPQTETTYIEMPYMDGSIPENTVYKNRFFNIVAWSKDGLTTAEKEQMKVDIARVLDSTKGRTKKMTFKSNDIAFDVKYSGQAEIKSGPSFVKATMPFEAAPYGHREFDQLVFGSGLLANDGDAPASIINEIEGGCKNPSFIIGSNEYRWNGAVPVDAKLIVNHGELSCYLEYNNGKTEMAEDRLTGDYTSIPVGKTFALTASDGTEKYIRTTVIENILWKA